MAYKVVSVEDNIEITELICFVLAHDSIELLTTHTGIEGLALIQQVKPDLVMLDIMIPDMDGWTIYDTIRADEELKDTPIIMLSVLNERPERRKAFARSSIDYYVNKPFDTLRLRSVVEQMLGDEQLWNVLI